MRRLELPPDLAARVTALPEGVIAPEAQGRAAEMGAALRAAEEAARAALAEARGAREAARAEGLAEGRAEGVRRAVEGLAAHHRGLDAIRVEQEARVSALALEIVEAVLGSVPEARRVGLAVRQAVRRSGVGGRVRVAAPPGATEAVAGTLRDGLGPGVEIEVAADPTLRPGAARLDTALGRIDVGAEEGLRVVRAALGLSEAPDETAATARPPGPPGGVRRAPPGSAPEDPPAPPTPGSSPLETPALTRSPGRHGTGPAQTAAPPDQAAADPGFRDGLPPPPARARRSDGLPPPVPRGAA